MELSVSIKNFAIPQHKAADVDHKDFMKNVRFIQRSRGRYAVLEREVVENGIFTSI